MRGSSGRVRLRPGAALPLVCVTASGGARMQEGILSLMQLPKTVCAVEELREARSAFLCVMTHPTTAGVLASFASLGDVTVAEPGALLSFTGPTRRPADRPREAARRLWAHRGELPARSSRWHRDAQRASALPGPRALALRDGGMRPTPQRPVSASSSCGSVSGWRSSASFPCCGVRGCTGELARIRRQIERIAQSRRRTRSGVPSSSRGTRSGPYTLDYVERLFDDFVELHGDRAASRRPRDRRPASAASTGGRSSLVGHQKGRDTKEKYAPQLRDGAARGLSQGDPADGAGRPSRLPDPLLHRHAGRVPGRRRRGARPGRRRSHARSWRWRGSRCPIVACVIGEGGSGGASRSASPTGC